MLSCWCPTMFFVVPGDSASRSRPPGTALLHEGRR